MKTRETIKASIVLIPRLIKKRSKIVSNAVTLIPQISGRPNNKFSPIAIPTISARSQAAIAISAKIYNGMFAHLG